MAGLVREGHHQEDQTLEAAISDLDVSQHNQNIIYNLACVCIGPTRPGRPGQERPPPRRPDFGSGFGRKSTELTVM